MLSFYSQSLLGFLEEQNSSIIGQLTSGSSKAGFYQQVHTQTKSWEKQLDILKANLGCVQGESWGLLLEYPIPRRDKRIDTVILARDIIFVLEFKVGAKDYLNHDKTQVEDYCLDLRDFHKESLEKTIIPILVSTEAQDIKGQKFEVNNYVHEVLLANKNNLAEFINLCVEKYVGKGVIALESWNSSEYSPTPTIIEAAQHLYSGKNVREISRSQAGSDNLNNTTQVVMKAIEEAKKNGHKIICFITGVPGAGKTLAGLNIVHNHKLHSEGNLGVFLSGNGPLVKVLSEALARDNSERTKTSIKESRRQVSTFIQNVHQFLDLYFYDPNKIPIDKVVLFDEAQRAWNKEHSKRKFDRDFSEPEMMLSIMDRHSDWAVIVALIGGGQEINTGEAGLAEWGRNLLEKFPGWKIYISPELKGGHHSTAGLTLFPETPQCIEINEHSDLHLKVSIRSYKAELLSQWVSELLEGNCQRASEILQTSLKNYPIVLTRDLSKARDWLWKNCRGSRRSGLVATSGARRLRPLGLDVTLDLDVPLWFLQEKEDVRSSSFLELAATEFAVQGLELDWVGLCWDADLRRNNSGWEFCSFKGTKWQKVNKDDMKQYIINKYRVLLTRAREGLIIWIPNGSETDKTRDPKYYDSIARYLKSCGIPEI